jgi:hypothetical protein
MQIFIADAQMVTGTNSVIFGLVQPSVNPADVFLQNAGTNTLNYDFQYYDPVNGWTDMGEIGSIYYQAILPGQNVLVPITSLANQVQLVGSASGGTLLQFAVTRLVNRAPGANIPILNV